MGFMLAPHEVAFRRRLAAARMRREARASIGVYWWLPIPSSPIRRRGDHREFTWTLSTFTDEAFEGGIDHVDAWSFVLAELRRRWKEPIFGLEHAYACLPRGRVSSATQGLRVFHGGDAPIAGWLAAVTRAFNLPPNTRAELDMHEVRIREDVDALEKALGIDLRLDDPLDPTW